MMIFNSLLLLLFTALATATDQNPYSPIRILFFLTKSANITEEEFHYHYSTHHGPLVTPWLKKYGIIEYNQVSSSCLRDTNNSLISYSSMLHPSNEMPSSRCRVLQPPLAVTTPSRSSSLRA